MSFKRKYSRLQRMRQGDYCRRKKKADHVRSRKRHIITGKEKEDHHKKEDKADDYWRFGAKRDFIKVYYADCFSEGYLLKPEPYRTKRKTDYAEKREDR